MSQPKIAALTPDQEALIPLILEKWRRIALSTEPLNREKAEAAVKTAYAVMGKTEPEIRFLSSPFAARSEILSSQSPREMAQQLGAPILIAFSMGLRTQIQNQLQAKLWENLEKKIQRQEVQKSQAWIGLIWVSPTTLSEVEQQMLNQLRDQLMLQFASQQPGGNVIVPIWEILWQQVGQPLWQNISQKSVIQWLYEQSHLQSWFETVDIALPGMYSYLLYLSLDPFTAALIDFCVTGLNCQHDEKKWTALQSLVTDCGLVFPFEKTCFVCDRPIKLSLDSRNRLHAEGEAAVEFADGNKLYFYENVPLPEKYGAVHPQEWQEEWLEEEPNDKVREVLERVIRDHSTKS